MFCVTYVPYGEQSVPLEPQPYRENDDYYEEEYREEQDGPE
jgi:hypothetical protein